MFAKPPALDHPAAANLLLAGTTAAEMLHVTGVREGDTVVVHGASGAVGVSVLQQAREVGVRCVGTASEHNFDVVRRFGGEPVSYGDGLADRLRAPAPDGFVAAQRFRLSDSQLSGFPRSDHRFLAIYEIDGDPSRAFELLERELESGRIVLPASINAADIRPWCYTPITDRMTAGEGRAAARA